MQENKTLPKTVSLQDYQPPAYLVDSVQLYFSLFDEFTLVTSTLALKRNPVLQAEQPVALVLNGVDLELLELILEDQALPETAYQLEGENLTIHSVPRRCTLVVRTRIYPHKNTSLEGLYVSNGMYCTQCEAEGFRKITYYPDRPDVMSRFTTTIEADQKRYPVLLSNGNPIEKGLTDSGRHWVKWEDRFKKPCYLFALVAGQLQSKTAHYKTISGREVELTIYVEPQDLDKVDHALLSLQKSMVWDEQIYGREYDLDIYMIVAVSHFNMGAMENKGLNIFNTSCVLAHPKTTTDASFQRVEGVIAHEYFHNWSGNRVTCRDWFQLTLKEGFTVFRDQEFSADMGSRAIKRVKDVSLLRAHQFVEDAGPMAHPVRPSTYIEINNLYTATVYEKGAEIVRMLHTLVGPEGFRKGCDLYFDRYDGQAVTCEDFVGAIEEANGVDLSQFKVWYAQAGTPEIAVTDEYDAGKKLYRLHMTQAINVPTEVSSTQSVLHIPIKVALMGAQGQPIDFCLHKSDVGGGRSLQETVLSFVEEQQTFEFYEVLEKPVPSLLRDFSAPVRLKYPYTIKQLAFLMAHDTDSFNRWDAGETLKVQEVLAAVERLNVQAEPQFSNDLLAAYESILTVDYADKAEQALMLQLPQQDYISGFMTEIQVDEIFNARRILQKAVVDRCRERMYALYEQNQPVGIYEPSVEQIATRHLKNTLLSFLSIEADDDMQTLCFKQFEQANNMTDQSLALRLLVHEDFVVAEEVLARFYQQWAHEPLVVDLWLSVQATKPHANTLAVVKTLRTHKAFDLNNPNRIRALIGSFCHANVTQFHRPDGAGYAFLADTVLELNGINAQVAARMLMPLTRWRKYNSHRQNLMQEALTRIINEPNLSKDVYEVASKSLKSIE